MITLYVHIIINNLSFISRIFQYISFSNRGVIKRIYAFCFGLGHAFSINNEIFHHILIFIHLKFYFSTMIYNPVHGRVSCMKNSSTISPSIVFTSFPHCSSVPPQSYPPAPLLNKVLTKDQFCVCCLWEFVISLLCFYYTSHTREITHCPSPLTNFTQHDTLQIHPCSSKLHDIFFFSDSPPYLAVYMYQLSVLGHLACFQVWACKYCCSEHF